jgi:hypothetical protein
MRMMLKATIPVDAGNAAIKSGALAAAMQKTTELLKPEAAYFLAQDGQRSALFFFDMKDASQIPVIAEPLFMSMNASLTITPVMNAEELQKGLAEAAKNF